MQSAASENKSYSYLHAAYTGSSRTSIFNRKKRARSLETAAIGSLNIDSFFHPISKPGLEPKPEPEPEPELKLEPEPEHESESTYITPANEANNESIHGKMIIEISDYLVNKTISTEENIKLQAVQQYLRIHQTVMKKNDACQQVALINGKSLYWGCCILSWANQWKTNKKIILSCQGKHPKTKNLLADNDIYLLISSWIRTYHKYDITPLMLQKHMNEIILTTVGITNERKRISKRTVTRWLKALGWIRSNAKKGVYIDGHERPDVVAYRVHFLQQMQEYEQHMIKAKDGDPTTLEFPNSPNGERILIFYTHDECIFYSNDGQRTIWHPTGEMPLRKKGQGQSIMVSEFLSEVDGPLGVREIIYPGKNCDGYWTGKDVAKQFTKAIMAHKKSTPTTMSFRLLIISRITIVLLMTPCS